MPTGLQGGVFLFIPHGPHSVSFPPLSLPFGSVHIKVQQIRQLVKLHTPEPSLRPTNCLGLSLYLNCSIQDHRSTLYVRTDQRKMLSYERACVPKELYALQTGARCRPLLSDHFCFGLPLKKTDNRLSNNFHPVTAELVPGHSANRCQSRPCHGTDDGRKTESSRCLG